MTSTPRWHCSFCKRDVKFADIWTEIDAVRRCPVCHNNSVVFLQFTPRQRRAATSRAEPFLKRQQTATIEILTDGISYVNGEPYQDGKPALKINPPTAADFIGANIFKTT